MKEEKLRIWTNKQNKKGWVKNCCKDDQQKDNEQIDFKQMNLGSYQ